jgi:ferredoxin
LSRHGYVRRIDVEEGLDLLQEACDPKLVQFGENVRNSVNFICNCCGTCVNACPVEAMALVSANDPHRQVKRKAKLDAALCLGCGICLRTCSVGGLRLAPRAEKVITPVNSTHRTVLMAIERGKLQNLIFDRHVLLSHRAMAAVLSDPEIAALETAYGKPADAIPLSGKPASSLSALNCKYWTTTSSIS